jgi:two-component system, chemotaxis family, chemotaxis protein CheY
MTQMTETFDPSQLRILVVDDNQQMREILRTMLRAFGVTEVTVAVDGGHALEKLDTGQFDLAICDWMMAPMDGLAFVRNVRRSPRPTLRGLPILMLTAQAEKQNVIDARKAGVDAYLVKPVSAAQFWARLQPIAAKAASSRRTEDATATRAIAAAGNGLSHMTTAYREVLRLDCDDLGRALSLLVRSDWNNTGIWQAMFKKSHDVKGQAGSFGYVLATDLAGRLCATLRPVLDDFARRNARPDALKSLLETTVGGLELIAREDMAGDGGSEGYGLLAQIDTDLDALLATWGATR